MVSLQNPNCLLRLVALVALGLVLDAGCSDDDATKPTQDGSVTTAEGGAFDLGNAGDLADHCATVKLDRTCTIGAAYARCEISVDIGGGGGVVGGGFTFEPRLFCSALRCLWVADGCPLRGYENLIDAQCRCSGAGCDSASHAAKHFYAQYGSKPWSAARGPLLSVTVDPNAGGQFVKPSCSGCPACIDKRDTPCSGEVLSRKIDASTQVVSIEPAGYLSGWRLEIEVELGAKAKHARVCRHPLTDSISCTAEEPICASGGSVTVRSTSPAGELHGRYDVSFPDGLSISGEL